MMSGIRGKNTRPELRVRRFLHHRGFRFRLHDPALPGKPDIVLPRHRTVVLVHGCFWHRHAGCPFSYSPSSNSLFWADKFRQNQERDARQIEALTQSGWAVTIVWECETRSDDELALALAGLTQRAGR
jgi:DNA mismatch endonuclease (patch repair protein)